MNRIDKQFQLLKENNQKALITFMVAGHPSIEATEALIYAKERGGAHIIEIGIPYSDPLADGPVIQKAAQQALDKGIRLGDIFACMERVRRKTQIPLIFLVYYNTIFAYGIKRFITACQEAGIDGLIIPDLPMEEKEELNPFLHGTDIAIIPLVAPTSKERVKALLQGGRGFVYCISSLGVTGMRQEFHAELDSFLSSVREATALPIAVGFGISGKEDVKKMQPYVDGVIVGSAIVREIEESGGNPIEIEAFVRMLSDI